MKHDMFFLRQLAPLSDLSLFALRILTGAFLIWEMWFNISNAETMKLVVSYFADNGFYYPAFFAPLSAWAQFSIGIALVIGFLTRWAGLLLAFNFVVGVAMVHWNESFREWWPAVILVALGLHFAAAGGGRFALDAALTRTDSA